MEAGSSTINQLQCIVDQLGYPSSSDILSFESDFAKQLFESVLDNGPKDLADALPGMSEDALDFLSSLLQLNPQHRLSAAVRKLLCFSEFF